MFWTKYKCFYCVWLFMQLSCSHASVDQATTCTPTSTVDCSCCNKTCQMCSEKGLDARGPVGLIYTYAGVVLLFGGRSLDFWSCLNDSWIYSLLGSEGWRQVVSPISPFRRYLSSMSRTTLGRVVLFGGAQLDEECFECSPMAVNDTSRVPRVGTK